MNNEKTVWEQFDDRFWEHRIPRNTKQSADIKDWIASRFVSKDALREKIEGLGLVGDDAVSRDAVLALLNEQTP